MSEQTRPVSKHKRTSRKSVNLPTAAWNWRMRRIPGASFATLDVVEQAFMAGAKWARRRIS